MRIVTMCAGFYLYEIDSELELREYVDDGVLVGEDVQYKSKFYMIDVLSENNNKRIGIFNEGHGVTPVVYKNEQTDLVFVTSDKSFYIIDSNKKLIIKKIQCDSLIFDVLIMEAKNRIFLICELGLECLTTEGNKVWSHESDIISNFDFQDDYVKLIVEDSVYKISLLTGERL